MKNRSLLFLATLLCISSLLAEIPAGYYYLANNRTGAELKAVLNRIISQGKFLAYGSGAGSTWQAFYYTDRNAENSEVYDMYSNVVRTQSDFDSVSDMDIEHALPSSWWGSYKNNAYRDLYHLFPSDRTTNITKKDLPLGEVIEPASLLDNGVSKVGKNGFGASYSGNCFEPADEYKGDFARAYFYVATAYEELSSLWRSPVMQNNTYPVFTPWTTELLLKWHRNDPVSAKELARVEAVYGFQGNRNPYIDYPELVEHIWGDNIGVNFTFPEEQNPFLIAPTRWETLSYGVVMQHNAQQVDIAFKGLNIREDVRLALKRGTPELTLSTNILTSVQVLQGATLTISYSAKTIGALYDTLVITSNELPSVLEIPIRGQVSDNFMTLEPSVITSTTAELNWMKHADATHYTATVQQGASLATDLYISAYAEGTSGFNKALAIYNGTGKTVDLSKYSLRKQSNGSGPFTIETHLSGMLAHNEVCVVVHRDADRIASPTIFLGDQGVDAARLVMAFNGDDAMALYHSGIMIDVVGEVDNPMSWGADKTLKRSGTVVGPTTHFNWNEWTNVGKDQFEGLNVHHQEFTTPTYLHQVLNVGGGESYTLTGLSPENEYVYTITAIGEENSPTVNGVRFVTSKLEAPLAIDASVWGDTSFEAEWESVPDATHYFIDVYELVGVQPETDEDGFSDKAASIEKGWDFGKTTTYTNTAFVGKAQPSIRFEAEQQTVSSRVYPHSATQLDFMYKYASDKAARGSILAIDGFNGTTWVNIDSLKNSGSTAKNYPSYRFAPTDHYTQFRFVYAVQKGGNLALDDVAVTYGNVDTTYLIQNQTVMLPPYLVRGASPSTTYHYRVRTAIHEHLSAYSNEITVTTKERSTSTSEQQYPRFRVINTEVGIKIEGLQPNSTVTLYRINGAVLMQQRAGYDLELSLPAQGVYILQVTDNNHSTVTKLVR